MPRALPHGGCRWAALLAIAAGAPRMAAAVEEQEEVRRLYEIPLSQMPEPGMQPFVDKYMEPSGAACMAYVRSGSKNHKLMQKLASATEQSDQALYELALPMGAVLDYEEVESLVIVKRQYMKHVWDVLNQSGLDEEPIVYEGPPGKPWKKQEVRRWMLDNAFPTFNFRLRSDSGRIARFPWYKYFGVPNKMGVGVVALNFTDFDVEQLQVRMVTTLRPYIKKLLGKFHFTVMEKSEFTLPARMVSKLAFDHTIQAELILIEDPQTVVPRAKVENFWHGNPRKYRLLNFTKEHLSDFFSGHTAKKLPTYWASRELIDWDSQKDAACFHLTSDTYQENILQADERTGAFVAFFNMDPEDGCGVCVERIGIWRKVAKELKRKHKLLGDILFGTLDQSASEHPESKVAGRLGEPVIMWYPPGKPKQRWRNRLFLHDLAIHFTQEELERNVMDFVQDQLDAEL